MTHSFDLRWKIHSCNWIPLQHRYFLLAALSRVVPEFHAGRRVGVHPIQGIRIGSGRLKLTDCSAVTVRAPLDWLPKLMPLSGRKLDLGGSSIRLSVPEIVALSPSPRLYSVVVTIKGFLEPEPFSGALIRQLDTMGIRRSVSLEIGRRRVIQVKERTIVGFHVRMQGLTEEESHRLQVEGLGGRRHLGCGLFLPDHLKCDPQKVEAV